MTHPPPLLLLALAACRPGAPDCPPGSERQGDGLCHLDEAGGETGAPDTGAPDTGDAGGDWIAVPAGCEAPADPATHPVEALGRLDVQSYLFAELVDIEVDTDRGLVLAAGQGGLVTVDVSDPEAPAFLDSVGQAGDASRFQRLALGADGRVYVTHRDQGLWVVDASDPADLRLVASVAASDLGGMARSGDVLWATTHTGGLVTFDLADPDAPVELGRIDGLGNPWLPLLAGDRLYVADNSLGIGVVDVSDPRSPALVGTVEAAGGVQDLALSGDGSTLYAAVGSAGVEVFSLDDPDAPASVGVVGLNAAVISVAVDGDALWAADQQDVVALDVDDPRAPAVRNTRETEQWAMHVAAGGGVAWVADWAWVEGYRLLDGVTAPDADPSTGQIYLPDEGGTATFELANLGSAPLAILGASASDDRLVLEADRLSLEPGEAATLRLTYGGGGDPLELATLCLATDDPDEPLQEIAVFDGATGEGTGLGSPAPDFTLTDLDGRSHTLSDQLGRPVVLTYFATW